MQVSVNTLQFFVEQSKTKKHLNGKLPGKSLLSFWIHFS